MNNIYQKQINDILDTAKKNDLKKLKQLLLSDIDILKYKDKMFFIALENDNYEMFVYLIEDKKFIPDEKIIIFSAQFGKIDFLKYLYNNNFLSIVDKNELFSTSIKSSSLENVKFLFQIFDININSEKFFIQAVENESYPIMDFLLGKGADINQFHCEALNIAVVKNNFSLVDYLFKRGIDPAKGNFEAPKICAVIGNLPMLEYLLTKFNIDINFNNRVLLLISASKQDVRLAEYLIGKGINTEKI